MAIGLALFEVNAIVFAMLGRSCTMHGFDVKQATDYLLFIWAFWVVSILGVLLYLVVPAVVAYLILKRLPLDDSRWIYGIVGLTIIVPLCFALFTPNALHPQSCPYP